MCVRDGDGTWLREDMINEVCYYVSSEGSEMGREGGGGEGRKDG